MESLFKEGKMIVHSYTKRAKPDEIEAEIIGYAHAQQVGMQVAKLLHHTDTFLTVERVDGISCFRYLELLRLHGQEFFPGIEKILRFLLEEIRRFQSEPFPQELNSAPYAAKEKTDKVAEVMCMLGHARHQEIARRTSEIAELFNRFATVSFRDATPKNSILQGVYRDNALTVPVDEVIAAIRHIDFRSSAELVPRMDDYISTLLHYMIPAGMRNEFYQEFDINQSSIEFVVSQFVRMARFWGRRHFYFRCHPNLYRTRYDLEDLSFYDEQFNIATEALLEVL